MENINVYIAEFGHWNNGHVHHLKQKTENIMCEEDEKVLKFFKWLAWGSGRLQFI